MQPVSTQQCRLAEKAARLTFLDVRTWRLGWLEGWERAWSIRCPELVEEQVHSTPLLLHSTPPLLCGCHSAAAAAAILMLARWWLLITLKLLA